MDRTEVHCDKVVMKEYKSRMIPHVRHDRLLLSREIRQARGGRMIEGRVPDRLERYILCALLARKNRVKSNEITPGGTRRVSVV